MLYMVLSHMINQAYQRLNVPSTASMEVIRAAYLAAARKHHPDKLSHLDASERAEHEAIFKEITDAYSRIVENRARASCPDDATNAEFVHAWKAPKRPEEWEAIWEGLEKMFSKTEVLCTVKDLFMKASKLKKDWAKAREAAAAADDSSDTSTSSDCGVTHKATLMVSPADVQGGRKRRVRILHDDGSVAAHICVDCGVFPDVYREQDVEVKMVLKEDESMEYESGIWDLFKTLNLNLVEWFTGGRHEITAIAASGTPLIVEIPACVNHEMPICINDADYWKFGPIYVTLCLKLPSPEFWKKKNIEEQEKLLAVLRDVVC